MGFEENRKLLQILHISYYKTSTFLCLGFLEYRIELTHIEIIVSLTKENIILIFWHHKKKEKKNVVEPKSMRPWARGKFEKYNGKISEDGRNMFVFMILASIEQAFDQPVLEKY